MYHLLLRLLPWFWDKPLSNKYIVSPCKQDLFSGACRWNEGCDETTPPSQVAGEPATKVRLFRTQDQRWERVSTIVNARWLNPAVTICAWRQAKPKSLCLYHSLIADLRLFSQRCPGLPRPVANSRFHLLPGSWLRLSALLASLALSWPSSASPWLLGCGTRARFLPSFPSSWPFLGSSCPFAPAPLSKTLRPWAVSWQSPGQDNPKGKGEDSAVR
ncbi:hypothetical protein B0H67DRAFT_274654 [Lasiosphaeris hirsuta]|uniref:Uncharacterized protein n=1 Tax=Lasiosphaeris hirsuta TaxID=260670 RepID=A0AA40A891_9PEZI|nr:hypothetical protein B0H67DRAFT_274654 [Lasiosphaeris hirsuta]